MIRLLTLMLLLAPGVGLLSSSAFAAGLPGSSGALLITATSQTSDDAVAEQEGVVKVRTSVMTKPSSNSGRITRLNSGTKLTVLGKDKSGRWFHVRLPDGREGWSPARLIKLLPKPEPKPEPEPEPEPAPAPAPQPEPLPADAVIVWPLQFDGMMPKGLVESIEAQIVAQIPEKTKQPTLPVATAWETHGPKAKPVPTCGMDDSACIESAGSDLAVRYHVIGKLASGDGGWVLHLSLIDAARSQRNDNPAQTLEATEQTLPAEIGQAVVWLFGLEKPAPVVVAPVVQPEPEPAPAPEPEPEPEPKPEPEPEPEPATPQTEKHEASVYEVTGGVLLGLGVMTTLTGGAATAMAYFKADQFEQGNTGAKSENKTWTSVAIAGYAAGGAMLVTGIVLLVVDPGKAPDEGTPTTMIGPTDDGQGALLSVSGRW